MLGYQPTIDLPVADLHIGIRVEAVWASDAELDDLGLHTRRAASSGGSPPASPT